MFAFTRFMDITFTVNDCFFFGAIISATDPGILLSYQNLNLQCATLLRVTNQYDLCEAFN